MINREKLLKAVDAVEKFSDIADIDVTANKTGLTVRMYPVNWWRGTTFTEEQRHSILATLTPLVGRLNKSSSEGIISYEGTQEGCKVYICKAEACKVIGYKKVTKRVPVTETRMVVKEEEVETGDYVEEEAEVPVTDCDVRSGRASEEDLEVTA